jgi:hypothetical protein
MWRTASFGGKVVRWPKRMVRHCVASRSQYRGDERSCCISQALPAALQNWRFW